VHDTVRRFRAGRGTPPGRGAAEKNGTNTGKGVSMAKWVKAAREDEVSRSARVVLGKNQIALFRLEDGVYALDDICSHEYSRLSEGEIWDDDVYCPKHGSRFEIRTGAVHGLPATKPVKSYPVKIENGEIWVKV
jgi:3-phenylpropionate/trans-cinnamate dioxygenase ferredoxin subunit